MMVRMMAVWAMVVKQYYRYHSSCQLLPYGIVVVIIFIV